MSTSISLPTDFINSIVSQYGQEFSNALCRNLDEGQSERSIRINPYKFNQPTALPTIPWCEEGYQVAGDLTFTYDPLFHAGCYYVQEAASMFIAQVLSSLKFENDEPLAFLDLCAAPGGKSTLLASWLGDKGLLVSNEIISSRVEILKENIIKWGLGNSIITNNDSSLYAQIGEVFDLVLIDAPCSGEGLFRKDLKARNEWNLDQVNVNVDRQREIIDNGWSALKENGYLLYSTCTFNQQENEEQVQYLVDKYDAEVITIHVDEAWKITVSENQSSYRFFPHLTAGEGFAIAVLRKKASSNSEKHSYKSKARSPIQPLKVFSVHALLPTYKGKYYQANDQLLALTDQQYAWCTGPLNKHYIKYAGIDLGTFKQKDFIPSHALALSIYFNHQLYPVLELDEEQAIGYLMKEQQNFELSTKGIHLVQYKNASLGFIKIISATRSNNNYPNEWKIRNASQNQTSHFQLIKAL